MEEVAFAAGRAGGAAAAAGSQPSRAAELSSRLPQPLAMATAGRRRTSAAACLATGSLIVNCVPLPTVLSTRMRPWWASMIWRQEDRPRPVPPLPVSSGPVLVVKKGSKIRGSLSAGMPQPVSRTTRSTVSAAASCSQANEHAAAAGHGLAGVDQQVEQHLLNLVADRQHVGHVGQVRFDRDAILGQLALQQHERVVDDLLQVGRLEVARAVAGDGENGAGDLRGPLRGGEDFFEGLVAGRLRPCAAGPCGRS